jgi:hypothetical protein
VSRPELADQYYEQLWRGIEYYNAQLLYENNLKGLFVYFKNKNKIHLLANEPTNLKDRWGYKSNNRGKGFHATPESNRLARELLNSWSLETVQIGQNEEDGSAITVPRMFHIKSRALLQEMERWTSKGNFDRVSGIGACMLLMAERNLSMDTVEENVKSVVQGSLFNRLRQTMSPNKMNYFKSLIQ